MLLNRNVKWKIHWSLQLAWIPWLVLDDVLLVAAPCLCHLQVQHHRGNHYYSSLLMAAPSLRHFQVQHYFSLSLISKSSAILISSLFSQLDLAKRRAFYWRKSFTNRDIRSGDFWRETAEDHTTRGDVAHLNLQGHKACHASGKRPVKYKTDQKQQQESHTIKNKINYKNSAAFSNTTATDL